MSRWTKGFLALFAASLAMGAVQLEMASGSDLKAGSSGDAGLLGTRGLAPEQTMPAAHDVNRTAKSDRMGAPSPGVSGPTIVFTVNGLPNTSVATFTPLFREETSSSSRRKSTPARGIMQTAACEPPVSALTELARQIENGRCVT